MALIKQIPDPSGPGTIDAYAKLDRLLILTRLKTIQVGVAVYRSQAARDAVDADGRPVYDPVRVETYTVTDDPESDPTYTQFFATDVANPNGIGAQVYGFLKAFTGWSGAKDA